MPKSSDGSGEGSSDEGANERRLSSLVLRPAITNLPSIGGDGASDDDDSSVGETEVVFSHINWAAQESMIGDEELVSPGRQRMPAVAESPRGTPRPIPPSTLLGALPSSVSAARTEVAKSPGQTRDSVSSVPPTTRPEPAAQSSAAAPTAATARPLARAAQQVASDADNTEDEDGSSTGAGALDVDYEGRGWLSGAAGRLANVEERKRAAAAASDADHVAAAARDAAALQLQLQQLAIAASLAADALGTAAASSATVSPGITSAAADAVAAPGVGGGPGDASESSTSPVRAAVLQKLREADREREHRIAADFHAAIQEAEAEPLLVAAAGVSLDAGPVAGLGLDDLDALIARLSSGAAGMGAGGAGAGPSTSSAAADPGTSKSAWVAELPAADSLWSDEEEEKKPPPPPRPAASGRQPGQTAAAPAKPVTAAPTPAPAPSTAATVRATPTAAAAALAPASPGGEPPPPPPPMPAKFKFFAAPSQPGAAAPAGGGTASAAPGADGGSSGPVKVDLRQSIAEVAERNQREAHEAAERAARAAEAEAAARASEAKAAAARRRVVDSDDDSDDDQEEARRAARVRPQPPPKPTPAAAPAAPLAAPPAPVAPAAAAPAPQKVTATASGGISTDLKTAAASAGATVNTGAGSATAMSRRLPLSDSNTSSSSVAARSGSSSGTAGSSTGASSRSITLSGAAGGGGATAVASSSTGTDSSDLRASASKSVFVGTSDRKSAEAEEEERQQDIRAYLKARQEKQEREREAQEKQKQQSAEQEGSEDEDDANARPAAAAAAAAAAKSASERRWPSPPLAVAQREAAMGGHAHQSNGVKSPPGKAAAATATTTAPAATSTAVGPDSDEDEGGETPARSFAQCSTEGDEQWLAEPAPSTVVHASRERGARMAAAGTVLAPLAPAPATVSPSGISSASTSSAAAVSPAAHRSTPAAAAAAAAGGADNVRPASLQLASPAAAVSAAAGRASMSGASDGAGPPSLATPSSPHVDLGRLPAWLTPASAFTLLLTSPSNLPTAEVGLLLEWLLSAAAASRTSAPSGAVKGAPAFSMLSARLLGVPTASPLLSAAASAHFARPAAGAPGSGAAPPAASGGSSSGGGEVRVLAVACVARAGVDPDSYCHDALPAEAAAAAAPQLLKALGAVRWADVLPQSAGGSGSTSSGGGDEAAAAPQQQLLLQQPVGAWATARAGSEATLQLFDVLRVPTQALHQHGGAFSTPRGSLTGAASAGTPPGAAAAPAGTAADPPGVSTFVTLVSAGVLREPGLLRALLQRAGRLGLNLRGLQVLYATEEAAAALVAATPHRPVPFTGGALLALSGRHEPLRRWQAQLGPPDARLAALAEPGSLHALYGATVRHITASYDAAAGAREVAALFGGGLDAALASPRPGLQGGPAASPAAGGAGGAAAASAAWGLTACCPAQSQWLALSGAGAPRQAAALWCVQQLVWCGYSLRGLLLSALPPAALAGAYASASASAAGPLAVVVEVSKEEAAQQLPMLLSELPPLPGGAGGAAAAHAHPHAAAAAAAASQSALCSSEALRQQLTPAELHSLPPPYTADQLLSAAAAVAPDLAALADGAGRASWDGSGAGFGAGIASSAAADAAASVSSSGPGHHPHAEDGVAVVALQARPLHAAAAVLAALVGHLTAPAATAAVAADGMPAQQMELVGVRYLRQVPSDVAGALAVLQPTPVGATVSSSSPSSSAGVSAAAAAGAAGRHRLVISHPALLAAFNGPAAAARVAVLLQVAVSRLAAAAAGHDGAPARPGGDAGADVAAWSAVVDKLLRDYPTLALAASPAPAGGVPAAALAPPPQSAATPPPPPLLAAVSRTQAAAKTALARAFSSAQVFLDPGMHDGVHRPPLPEAAAASLPSPSALCRLLAGPARLPAVVALDFGAVGRNLLPRLIKAMAREGYALHAAATVTVGLGSALGAAMPALAELAPAVVLHVSRSNAVAHLRHLAAALAPPSAAPGANVVGAVGGGVYVCDTWRDAAAVVAEVWPAAAGTALLSTAAASPPVAGAPARRFVRPEGSRLLQLTAMVVTPGATQAAGTDASFPSLGGLGGPSAAAAPALDWARLADALEALHTEGFRLAGLRALPTTGRDLAALASRGAFRISPAQQQAVHASAAAAQAAAAAGAAAAAELVEAAAAAQPPHAQSQQQQQQQQQHEELEAEPAVSNVVLVALTRDNAVTTLQILLDEASAAAAAAAQRGGPGRRQAAAALAALGPGCVSVSHSPAAGEQQVLTAFEGGAFGAGGVALLKWE